MEEKLLTVEKDGRELQVNPNPDGLKELARFGWKVKQEVDTAAEKAAAEKAAAEKAAAEKAAAEKAAADKFNALAEQCKAAADQFNALAEQCKAKGIKVVAADTIETLTEKLSK